MNQDDLDKYEANLRQQLEEFQQQMAGWKAEIERAERIKNPLIRRYELLYVRAKMLPYRYNFEIWKSLIKWQKSWREMLNLFEVK